MRRLEGLPKLPRGLAIKVLSTPRKRFVGGNVFQTCLAGSKIRKGVATEKKIIVSALSGPTVRPKERPLFEEVGEQENQKKTVWAHTYPFGAYTP